MTELDERSALAAKIFPDEWARWYKVRGTTAQRQRQRLRKAAEIEVNVMRPLRAAGASCATCRSFKHRIDVGNYCSAESDFHGYVLAKSKGLCPLWHKKES